MTPKLRDQIMVAVKSLIGLSGTSLFFEGFPDGNDRFVELIVDTINGGRDVRFTLKIHLRNDPASPQIERREGLVELKERLESLIPRGVR